MTIASFMTTLLSDHSTGIHMTNQTFFPLVSFTNHFVSQSEIRGTIQNR